MSRFLFVAPPLTGHVNAPLAVAHALRELGHDVAWAGPETYLRPLVGPDTTVYPTGLRLYRPQADRGLVAIKTLWEKFVVPFARFILPAVDKAVEAFQPDVVAVDQHAVAGAVVAHRRGLRWASLAPQSMELTRPLRAIPKVEGWIRSQLDTVWGFSGVPGPAPVDLRFSPYLVIGFTSPVLTGTADLPAGAALVGPAIHKRLDTPEFPWDRLDPHRQQVLVSVGTLAGEVAADFYGRCVAGLAAMSGRVQAIVNAPPEMVPEAPDDMIVAARVPMLELLPSMDAVITHGGLNTVGEALAHAIPLVVAPIRNDQPIIASQVRDIGAGIRVPFARVTPTQVGAAVTTVLDDPSYRAAAATVRDSFPPEGGARAAADHLIRLASAPG